VVSSFGTDRSLGAIAFQLAIQFVVRFALGEIAGYVPQETAGERSIFERPASEFRPWLIVVVMTAGGIASGFLVYRFAPDAIQKDALKGATTFIYGGDNN